MFVKTKPLSSLLDEWHLMLSPKKLARLKKSWAEIFRWVALPLIDEEIFRNAFSEHTGRPNTSIRLLICLHLLKEWNDLTDQQVLEQLEYNLQWHYALDVEPDEAHTCQKTMHNFRVNLMENDRGQQLFAQITLALAQADGLKLGRQRMDSTHVMSNMAVLTRLGLFVETVTCFLKQLRNEAKEAFESLHEGYKRRYLDREGFFSDAKREQARRRISVVAEDIYALVSLFEMNVAVAALPSFELLLRLFEEQCEVVVGENEGDDGDEVAIGKKRVRLQAQVIEPKSVASDSLQSPHDPDATYGHKGKGYEAQITESCDEDNPYQVITGTAVNGAHESDHNALLPMLDQLEQSQMLPEELCADTSYGSGANIVECAKRGVNLQAPVPDPDTPPAIDHFAAPVGEQKTEKALSELESDKLRVPSLAVEGEQPITAFDFGVFNLFFMSASMYLSEFWAGIFSPVPAASAHPIGLQDFTFNKTFDLLVACPGGKAPETQHLTGNHGNQLKAVFSSEQCANCPMASCCPTRVLADGQRQLRRSPAALATEVRQYEQQQPAFKERYRIRSGIESSNHELKSRHGMDDIRVRGQPRVKLSVQLKSLAVNIKRSMEYHVSKMAAETPCPC